MHSSRAATGLWPLWALWLAFVVYGSLVPLDFRPIPWDQAWQRLLDAPMFQLGVERRADWIANGVLYLPVGFLTAVMLMGRGSGPRLGLRLLVVMLSAMLGITLAIGVELAQTAFPPRTVSRNDIVAEIVGTLLGAGMGVVVVNPFRHLLARLWEGGQPLVRATAPFYIAAFVLATLFPFDVLISAAEWREKLSGPQIGLLLTHANRQLGMFGSVAKLSMEVLAAVPLGVLLMASQADRRVRRDAGLVHAALMGSLLGVALELLQLALASGQSQGLSVLTRTLGVLGGALLWRQRKAVSAEALRAWVRHHSTALMLGWIPLLVVYHRLWRGPLLTPQEGMARLGGEIRFLPFYYHYYTSELHAVASTVAICALYAPLGVQGWAWRSGTGAIVLAAMLLSGLIEFAKAFLKGPHPDPTNVWLAGAAAWMTQTILQKLSQRPTSTAESGASP